LLQPLHSLQLLALIQLPVSARPFFRHDLLQGALAVIAFSVFLLAPGYMLGWAGNFFGFRRSSGAERLLLSVALSAGISPVLAVLVTRCASLTATLWLYIFISLIAAVLAFRKGSERNPCRWTLKGSTWLALVMAVLWAALALFELADLQLGHRLYLSVTTYDHSVRTAMVESVLRHGIPATNPFYLPHAKPAGLRYYYYWYVLCALVSRAVGVPARAAMTASVVWSGLALAAMIPLYLKHVLRCREGLRRTSLIGFTLLGVTGLDVIPNLLLYAQPVSVIYPDADWWDPNQVTGWMASLLWVPHHVASLTACLVGFLLLYGLHDEDGWARRMGMAALAGAAFASAAGLGLYVTFAFAVFLTAWSARLLLRGEVRAFASFVAAGAVSLALSIPYLRELSGAGAGEGFARFSVRDFPPLVDWLHAHGVVSVMAVQGISLLALPAIYCVEFGFFLLAGWWWLRGRRAASNGAQALWWMLGSSLLVGTFLRSAAIVSNDLGMRAVLPAQFVLLLFGAMWLGGEEWKKPGESSAGVALSGEARTSAAARVLRIAVLSTLALGALGTVHELVILRAYPLLVDAGQIERNEVFFPAAPQMGERTYLLRSGLEQLQSQVPDSAVVQYNPFPPTYPVLLLYSGRQRAAAMRDCGASFGGDPAGCRPILNLVAPLYFRNFYPGPVDVDATCRALGVQVLIATDADQAWSVPESWVWQRPTLVANSSLRAFGCGEYPLK
jgi:hypothetical protein